MQVIKDDQSLAEAIRVMKNQQRAELSLLKAHFEFTIDNLNPVNIVKEKIGEVVSSIGESVTSENFKTKALKIGVGLASGFLTKKLVVGSSGGFFRKLLGMGVQAAVSGFVMKKLPITEEVDHSQYRE
ncbi:hypothetical protein J2X31_002607 [Flavobacterium arsenatis]|uniref:Uncharacterized protein n=1 Tax=Flavobacterium arsenatis TaxID=1484332 RepID=A0ABU1TRT9_9FLAO|nr:hypothetical protein [Flavobacterium arsenatis]MDR6968584.1 hypothetical protein [Flavobacterium arsenatis]